VAGASAIFLTGPKPRPVTFDEYYGVKLGMSETDVKYAFGNPEKLDALSGILNGTLPIEFANLPKDKHLADYYRWVWTLPTGAEFEIGFDKDKRVNLISCTRLKNFAAKNPSPSCPRLNGIQDGDNEADIRRAFGDPDRRILKDFDDKSASPVLLLLMYDKKQVGFALGRDVTFQLLVQR
jgi:hypothetical protein